MVRAVMVLARRATLSFAFGSVLLLVIGVGSARAAGTPDDVGVVDPTSGVWYLRDGISGETTSFYFGNPGDTPFTGDWDCDGVDTPGLYRRADGYVYLRNSNTEGVADASFFFGNPGDSPLAGDFDGDGCDTVSIYRPSESRVFVVNRLGDGDRGLGVAETDYVWGDRGDTPFVGDFDGDGDDEVGLHRTTTGRVFLRYTHTAGSADAEFVFGDAGDRAVAGDWDGDGDATVGLFRPANGLYFLGNHNTGGAAELMVPYGATPTMPIAGAFGELPGGDLPPLGLVAEFTTYHPCCEARVTNIHLIADTVDGVVVLPGQTFSVNIFVGPRTTAKGYVPAGAIIGGILYCCDHPANIGGGVSQFATTLFNAIFFGGYDIVEHSPHSLYFTRYPMGREATIVSPTPDLVFHNDTVTPMLMDTSYTDTSITVRLYGNNEGRVSADTRLGQATPQDGGTVTLIRTITHASGAVTTQSWTHVYRERIDEDPAEPPPPSPPPPPIL